jgi:hypothetical protein
LFAGAVVGGTIAGGAYGYYGVPYYYGYPYQPYSYDYPYSYSYSPAYTDAVRTADIIPIITLGEGSS